MSEFKTFKDKANGDLPLRAPYAFVPLPDKILPSPNQNPSHSHPHTDGISGIIEMEWENETPLLIGGANDDNNQPFRIDGVHMLPGSSLRGMIRSITEIAAFGRLNFVDDFNGFIRDFNAQRWRQKMQISRNTRFNCGWLFKVNSNTGETYHLLPANETEPYPLEKIVKQINKTVQEWHNASLHQRLEWLNDTGLRGLCEASRFQGNDAEGYAQLVVAGATPTELQTGNNAKNKEYLAHWPDIPKPIKLDNKTGRYFLNALKRDANNHIGDPSANYSALLARASGFGSVPPDNASLDQQLKDPDQYAIPLFWRNTGGDKSQNNPTSNTMLSLTSLFAPAYENSLLDVAKRQQHDNGDFLDLPEALFGWVPPDANNSELHTRNAREQSWRGRVQFGIAKHTAGNTGLIEKNLPGISPRASFFPYYLRPKQDSTHPVDFDNPHAVLSGRKRYPARNQTANPPTIEGEAQNSTVKFLPKGQKFKSTIRVHNVTPRELGALLWSLTLGQIDTDQGFRHMLGRGKNWGHGQIKASICNHKLTKLIGNAKIEPKEAITEFKNWVLKELDQTDTEFETLEPIKWLLNTCHARTGEALHKAGALMYPGQTAADNDGASILTAYTRIKTHSTKEQKDDSKTIIQRPAPVSANKSGYIGLPPYPRKEQSDDQ